MFYERYSGELYHYGVKGMRWGVRNLSKTGGKRFKKSAKKFNKEADVYDKYDIKVKQLKKSKASKEDIIKAKNKRDEALFRARQHYAQAGKDYNTDYGQRLVEQKGYEGVSKSALAKIGIYGAGQLAAIGIGAATKSKEAYVGASAVAAILGYGLTKSASDDMDAANAYMTEKTKRKNRR